MCVCNIYIYIYIYISLISGDRCCYLVSRDRPIMIWWCTDCVGGENNPSWRMLKRNLSFSSKIVPRRKNVNILLSLLVRGINGQYFILNCESLNTNIFFSFRYTFKPTVILNVMYGLVKFILKFEKRLKIWMERNNHFKSSTKTKQKMYLKIIFPCFWFNG